MRIMKHTALVLSFAAALAAQTTPQDPRVELAQVIAVEEQERDLAKAETLYREAITGGKLSTEARQVAHMRLSRVLKSLGREKEAAAVMETLLREAPATALDDVTAKPQAQDAEREATLRAKAEELIRAHVERDPNTTQAGAELQFVHYTLAEQLLWVGETVVPVAIAAIERALAGSSYHPDKISGLAGMLWRIGGPQAAQWLTAAAKNPEPAYRYAFVRTAFQARTPAMLDVAAVYLRDPDAKVFETLLADADDPHRMLRRRLPTGAIVDAAIAGSTAHKVMLLGWAWAMALDEASLAKIVQLARAGLRDTDPAVGAAARQFLLTENAQDSVEGVELLLAELPRMGGKVPISMGRPMPDGRSRERFTKEQAQRLLPAVTACVRALGPDASQNLKAWCAFLLRDVVMPLGAEVVPDVLVWLDNGFENPWLLHGRITPANVRDIAARFGRLEVEADRQLLWVLAEVELPTELFPELHAKAAAAIARDPELVAALAAAMASTGHPEAAPWLLEHKAKIDKLPAALVKLGRRSQDERVRAAMRAVVQDAAADASARTTLLMALLSMHDAPALDLAVVHATSGHGDRLERHPYAKDPERGSMRVLQYLVEKNPDPPHGFTEDEVVAVLQKVAARQVPSDWQPRFWSHPAIPDRLLCELAVLVAVHPRRGPAIPGTLEAAANWFSLLLERSRGEGPAPTAMRERIGILLRHESHTVRKLLFTQMTGDEVVANRTAIEACLDVDDAACAVSAAHALRDADVGVDAQRLAGNRHPDVRTFALEVSGGETIARTLLADPDGSVRMAAASRCGAIVDKEAVPGLIHLLRDDSDSVREKAAEALTRIRFYHEQQAHWDRVLKGLDASPASAAEKLLLQAKPGAPKAQRLLAIKSLGVLGVPEALPFLIEWSADPDGEVASAAQAAITAIHLNPRK